jgi:hypothetical protein
MLGVRRSFASAAGLALISRCCGRHGTRFASLRRRHRPGLVADRRAGRARGVGRSTTCQVREFTLARDPGQVKRDGHTGRSAATEDSRSNIPAAALHTCSASHAGDMMCANHVLWTDDTEDCFLEGNGRPYIESSHDADRPTQSFPPPLLIERPRWSRGPRDCDLRAPLLYRGRGRGRL